MLKSPDYILFRLVLLLLLVLSSSQALTHPLSVSYSRFLIGMNEIEAIYRLPIDDMDLLLRLDQDLDDLVTVDELYVAHDELEAYVNKWVDIVVNGVEIDGVLQQSSIWADSGSFPYVELHFQYNSSLLINNIDVRVEVLRHLYSDHRTLAEFNIGQESEEFIFYRGNSWSGSLGATTNSWRSVKQFTFLGIEHIFSGYDHILFLIGLLLVGRGMRNLITIVTSFTIAHSLTLGMAVLGFFQPVAWLTEAAIALSIAYVGLENLIKKEIRHRWRITFVFGLVHGFGFASVLQGMDLQRDSLLLSLFSFNVGVEIGQLGILAICWPLLHQMTTNRHSIWVVRILSVLILIFGLIWFVERILW